MKILYWLVAIAFFTCSCDLLLVINIGGANTRIAQTVLVLVLAIAAARMIQTGKILWPRGATALAAWCGLQLILLFRDPGILPSAQLLALLMLSIGGVFALVQLYGRSDRIEELFRVYLQSFVFIAAFGIYQFVSPGLHLGYPLVQQWSKHGLIPRVSGFSYEPSFYATYMVMGWILLIDLRVSKARIVSSRTWLRLTWLVSAALFLSTSKTGWLLMMLEGLLRAWPHLRRPLEVHARRLRAGSLRVSLPPRRFFAWVFSITFISALVIFQVSRVVDLNIFIQGTGLNNTAAHSVNERLLRYEKTLEVVHQEPYLGLSLGGVAERIAQNNGDPADTAETIKTHWGFPVPLEVLAASGLIGIIPFLWFFLEITLGERSLLRARAGDERAKWLHALIRALAFEWLSLSVDQNLVRVYLWMHVSVLMAVAYNLRYHQPSSALARETGLEPSAQPHPA